METTEQIDKTYVPFTVGDFFQAGRERLGLTIVAGETGLDRQVLEPMTNRPGLALTGFYDCFACKRIQVIGQAERAYLLSLSPDVRCARIRALFERSIYCIIFACDMEVMPEVIACAEEYHVVVMRTPMLTRLFAHASTFVLETLGAPRARFYGTMVEVSGLGMFIEGAAGLGKSETALGLIRRGNALVADDLTVFRKDVANNEIYGSASPLTQFYMEIRGIGIIHVPSVFGVSAVRGEKQLDLIIVLKRYDELDASLDRTGADQQYRDVLGVPIPQIMIPVAPGRDLVNLVETAALEYKLRRAGYVAVNILDQQLKNQHAKEGGQDSGRQSKGNA